MNHFLGGDALKGMKQICNENGFVVEEHEVITDDGYILSIYRIPGTLNEDEGHTIN